MHTLKEASLDVRPVPTHDKRVQYVFMHAGITTLALGLAFDATALRSAGAVLFAVSSVLVVRSIGAVMRRVP